MNPIPPQAYTKDVLLKAYSWLQNQNNSIKEMASTPDVLVSLYLKAHRDGDDVLERPSIKNFKKELKSLAEMMGEFETPIASAAPATASHVLNTPLHESAPAMPASSRPVTSFVETHSTPAPSAGLHRGLDTKSQFMIQEVKELLNLSSEDEALRLIIKLGHQKAKSLV
jgi:hypothetical protein